jgi:hypothetical protein
MTIMTSFRHQGEDVDHSRLQGSAQSGMGAEDAARFIRDVRVITISPDTITGHASASGARPADVDFLNREISEFLDSVTDRGQKLH